MKVTLSKTTNSEKELEFEQNYSLENQKDLGNIAFSRRLMEIDLDKNGMFTFQQNKIHNRAEETTHRKIFNQRISLQ